MLMRSFAIRFAGRALAVLALAGATQTLAAAQLSDPQAILAESDAVRNPGKPFSLTVTLTEYTNGKQTDANALQAYSAINGRSGQFRSLIRFVAPARDVNKLMLKTGNDLWFFDPASKASVRISPQQRLLGQASNGDVVTVNFAQSYKATLEVEENIQDGDRQTRHAYKLALKSGAADDTYAAIEMWVETTTRRPIKARFFSDSGKLLKVAFYRRYREEMGAQRPTEIVIIDGLNPNLVTVMRYDSFVPRDVPDGWFQQDYLPRFQPE
ncbi:outer membrane lipoprotein-sorting protein [Cupriavidus sp. LEh25]|nr:MULTISPECIES: outer membrane lipoprotein-sorting protein [unclassified Cupriavidus]MBP0624092.1 outer membrane lipoprotein-sorting protein [Cupriavidus sp. LEh25]MDK2660801.1 outer membrane lipoprotein-sorting protein [Cupriavidus sp. LEh21]